MAEHPQRVSARNINQPIKVCSPLTPGKPEEFGETGSTARKEAEDANTWEAKPTTDVHLSSTPAPRSVICERSDAVAPPDALESSQLARLLKTATPPAVAALFVTLSLFGIAFKPPVSNGPTALC